MASETTDVAAAKAAMEAARIDVMECEKEIVSIKNALKSVTSTSSPGEKDEANALRLSALKIMGGSDESKQKMPTLKLQLSSPVEELTLTKLRDPLNEKSEGSVVTFRDVDVNVATLTVTAEGDGVNGVSAPYDLAPLCSYDWEKDDVLSLEKRIRKKISEIDVAIVPNEDDGAAAKAGASSSTAEEKTDEGDNTDTEKEEFKDAVEDVESPTKASDDGKAGTDEAVSVKESKSEEDTVVVDKKEENKEESKDTTKSDTETDKDEKETVDETKKEDDKEESEVKETSDDTKEESSEEPKPTDDGKKEEAAVEEKSESKETDDAESVEEIETSATSSTSTKTPAAVQKPVCAVKLRVEFEPSTKDLKDAIYDKLNEASKKKALAINRLRQSAAAVSRSAKASDSAGASSSSSGAAVKSGFLNKKSADTKKKEPNFMVRWYQKTLGPNSLLRTVGPIMKNYVIFFAAVVYMHYRGQDLALPPPV